MAWPDFSLTDLYTAIIAKLNSGFTSASKLFRDQTTGDLTHQIRYSSANKRLEYWTGSAWAALDFTGVAAGSAATATTASSASAIAGYSVGNASGNIPVSNGTVCTNLNAEKIGGLTAAQIQAGSVNWDTVAGGGLKNTSGVLSVNTTGAVALSGDNVTVQVDNSTIKVNGSNQLYAETYVPDQYVASSTGAQVNQDLYILPADGGASVENVALNTLGTTYTRMIEFACPVGGTLYSSFSLTNSTAALGHKAYAKIHVNGVAVGTEHIVSTNATITKSDSSITVAAGDRIQIYAKSVDGSSPAWVVVSNWALKSSSAYIPVTLMYVHTEGSLSYE